MAAVFFWRVCCIEWLQLGGNARLVPANINSIDTVQEPGRGMFSARENVKGICFY